MYGRSKTWEKVIEIMSGTKNKAERPKILPRRIAHKLPVCCKNHKTTTHISDASDWETIHGGCTLKCTVILPCGHECPLTCHPFDHDNVHCHHMNEVHLTCGHISTFLCGGEQTCPICPKARSPHKKTNSQATQGSSGSSNSWQSFAEEEQVRYAAAALLSTQKASGSSVKAATAEPSRLVELDDGVGDVARRAESLTLGDNSKDRRAQKSSSGESGGISLMD
jgi:helicase required for RNAi-mediated heterochromatin assembly 1